MAKLNLIGKNTEDVEFFTFEKFEYDKDKFKDCLKNYKKIEKEFDSIFDYSSKRYLVIGNNNDKLILVAYEFPNEDSSYYNKKETLNGFYSLDDNRFSVGDILIIGEKAYIYSDDKSDNKVLKLELDFKDFNKIKELTENSNHKISLNELDENIDVINNETLKTEIERIIQQREDDEKERERERIEKEKEYKEEKQRELNKNLSYQSYKKDSIFKFKVKKRYDEETDVECDKNKLITENMEIHLNKNFNNIFTFEELNEDLNNQHSQVYNIKLVGSIINKLVEKREDFEITNYGDLNQNLKFEFKSNKTHLNNASIRTNRLGSIFKALRGKKLNKEELELFGRISDMLYKFLNLNEFGLEREQLKKIKIPITSELISDKKIKITIFGKENIVEWNIVKDLFYRYGRSLSSNLDLGEFRKLMVFIGIEKEFYLNELKNKLIIEEL